MKSHPLGKQLNLDSKLNQRERLLAKKKFDEEFEKKFFERTGIRNESEDWNLENLINKYEFDMAQMEKEERSKIKKYIKTPDSKDIDPETGKPRKRSP
jgi:hypothetical protein